MVIFSLLCFLPQVFVVWPDSYRRASVHPSPGRPPCVKSRQHGCDGGARYTATGHSGSHTGTGAGDQDSGQSGSTGE